MSHAAGVDPLAELLAVVRRRYRVRSALRAAMLAVLSVCAVALLLLAADLVVQLPPTARRGLRWLPAAAAVLPLVLLIRAWTTVDDGRLTLLLDERASLGNVASTYHAPNTRGPVAEAFRLRSAKALGSVDASKVVSVGVGMPLGWAFTGTLITALIVGLSGAGHLTDRWWGAAGMQSPDEAVVPMSSTNSEPPTLGEIGLLVSAPSYTGLPERRSAPGDLLAALPGSVIEVRGGGTARPPELAVGVVGGASLTPVSSETGWVASWPVGPEDRGVAVTLGDADRITDQRVIPLRLLRDRPPTVELSAPAEDLVLATATGRIPIEVRAADDYGVVDLTLSWVRSRGGGESFAFDEGEWEWDQVERTADGQIGTLSLSLDGLDLEAGDVIHVRASAVDGNTVTGPGIGISETRQIRISRDDELFSVTTLIGFPIEREREPLLSQRMIILLTEELRDSSSTMTEDEYLRASQEIADEQSRLRARIGGQIFSRAIGASEDPEAHLDFEEGEAEVFLDELEGLVERGPVINPETGIATIANVDIPAHEHDSDPIVAINRSLLTVYNYMWDAERELRTARLDPSLVPQRLALDELQRVRASERVFARGRVTVPPVDVPAARGTGGVSDALPSARSPAPQRGGAETEVIAQLDALLTSTQVPTGRPAAIAISGLALDLLQVGGAPDVSDALVHAAASAEEGDAAETRASLGRALRLLTSSNTRASDTPLQPPMTLAAARYGARSGREESSSRGDRTRPPFRFATVRYSSGDWDSAPLVPQLLIHSLAQYTDLEVAPEGVVVDLSSPEVFKYPFLYLTGHLPVFFSEAEGRILTEFVERGGFIFIDDHNHDIDGAFHRSVTAELGRLFGMGRLVPVPGNHEIYSSFFEFEDGPPITGHELSGWGDGLIHRELYQIEEAGRISVLYSNKDYSSEWSYHADNKRFLAVDNTRFGVNILVYAMTR